MKRYVRCLLAVADQRFHALHFQEGTVVIFFGRIEADIDDEVDLLLQVVKNDGLIEEHEVEIIETVIVDGIQLERRFGVFNEVVSEVADEAARKGRQVFEARRLVVVKDLGNELFRMVRMDLDFGAGLDVDRAVLAVKSHLRVVADEGVAAPALGVFHAFQQIAVRADILDNAQYFKRRADVGIHAAADRHDFVVTLIGFYFFQTERFHMNLL